jgi:hypothetical protein
MQPEITRNTFLFVENVGSFHVHKILSLEPTLEQSVLSHPNSLGTVLRFSSHLRPSLQPDSILQVFLLTFFVYTIVLTSATFPTYLILLDLFVLITFDRQYKQPVTQKQFAVVTLIFKTSFLEEMSGRFQTIRFKPYTKHVKVTSSNTHFISPMMVNCKFCYPPSTIFTFVKTKFITHWQKR